MTATTQERELRAHGRRKPRVSMIGIHVGLILYTLLAIGPILLIIMNSFKSRRAIFDSPFSFPTAETFSMEGYETAFDRAAFERYFFNSIVVTVASIFLVVLFGAMAAHALAEYRFPGNTLMGLYLAVGVMIPIRLGTVSILKLMVSINLVNTHISLILVYTAMGLPLAVFILSQFFRQVANGIEQFTRRLKTILWQFGHQATHDCNQPLRQIRRAAVVGLVACSVQRHGSFVQLLVRQCHRLVGLEWWPTREQVIHGDAERIQVGSRIDV